MKADVKTIAIINWCDFKMPQDSLMVIFISIKCSFIYYTFIYYTEVGGKRRGNSDCNVYIEVFICNKKLIKVDLIN